MNPVRGAFVLVGLLCVCTCLVGVRASPLSFRSSVSQERLAVAFNLEYKEHAHDHDDTDDAETDMDDVDGDMTEDDWVLHTENVMTSWQNVMASLDGTFTAERNASDLFDECTVDLELCVRKALKEREPVDVFFGKIDSETYFRYREGFADVAEALSALAFYLFLVLEFFTELGDIRKSIRSRDSWERVSNRVFEMWWQISLPRLLVTKVLTPATHDPDPKEAVPITKRAEKIISYTHVKKYQIHVNVTFDKLARKLVGVQSPDRHGEIVTNELRERGRPPLPSCANCEGKHGTLEVGSGCYNCENGLTKLFDVLAAPLQSRRSELSIFKVVFKWDLFVDTSKLKASVDGRRTFFRRDAELLINNYWSAVADRSSFLWRVARQLLICAIFITYFAFNLRSDFFFLVWISIAKLILFFVGFKYFFVSKEAFLQFNSVITVIHFVECLLISWVFWHEGGAFRSAAIAWRVLQEIELNPMVFVVRAFPWWNTRRSLILQMVSAWLKSTFNIGRSVVTCNLQGDDDETGKPTSRDRNDSEESSDSGIRSRSLRRVTDLKDKARERASDLTKKAKRDADIAKRQFRQAQEDIATTFQYLNLSEEGTELMVNKVRNWLELVTQKNEKGRFIYVGAQDKYHQKNFRVRRVLNHNAFVLGDALGETPTLERFDVLKVDKAMFDFNESNPKLIRGIIHPESKYGFVRRGVFSCDTFLLANTSYWFNSYNLHNPNPLMNGDDNYIPEETRQEGQTELDVGSAPVTESWSEWTDWELSAWFEEDKDPLVHLTSPELDEQRRKKEKELYEAQKRKEADAKRVKDQNARLNELARQQRQKVRQIEEEAARLEGQNDNLEAQIEAKENLVKAKARQVQTYERQLKDAAAREKDLSNKLVNANGKLGTTEAKLRNSEKEASDLRSKLAAVEAKLTSAEVAKAEAEKRVRDLEQSSGSGGPDGQ